MSGSMVLHAAAAPVTRIGAPPATRVAAPPAGIVDVWCVALDAAGFPHAVMAATLDAGERQQAARRRTDGHAWAAARGARRTILASYLGVPGNVLQFTAGEFGKPRLAGVTGLEFSYARTEGLAVIAVAGDREVGVDVERENARTDIDLVARDFLPPHEAAALACLPPSPRRSAFFRAWAQHEARVKLHGTGITGNATATAHAPHPRVVVRALALPPGFAGAVAATDDGWRVRVREFPPGTE